MPPDSSPTPSQQNELGLSLGISLIGVLFTLLALALIAGVKTGPIQPGLGSILLGIFVIAWGLMFLASYYYSHKTFFLRALIWVCEKVSHPRSRKMAFFYFGLATFIGGTTLLGGLGVL